MTLPSTEFQDLEPIVMQAIQGDRQVIPALKTLLTAYPIFAETFNLVARTERAWTEYVTGVDLLSLEVIQRQLADLKTSLLAEGSSALEQLCVETIAVTWLAMMTAQAKAAEHSKKYGSLTNTQEAHLTATHKRFLTSIRELARVRALLKPQTKIQLNVAQQQVNVI